MTPYNIADVRVKEALKAINAGYVGMPIAAVRSLASRGHQPARGMVAEYDAALKERRRAEKMEEKRLGKEEFADFLLGD